MRRLETRCIPLLAIAFTTTLLLHPAAAEPAMPDTAERLRQHVEALAGEIGPRHQDDPESLLRTRAYLREQWEAMGHEVQTQAYDADGFAAQNLYVRLPCTEPDAPGLVVGAHHDTVPTTPGADDNASAVAVLLEVSRALAGSTTRVPVTLVTFANEEPPHFLGPEMGSAVFAKDLEERGVELELMICLEMVGCFDDAAGSQRYPDAVPAALRRVLPTRGDFLVSIPNPAGRAAAERLRAAAAEGRDLRLLGPPLPCGLWKEFWLSDHGPFWDRGFPAVMITDTSWFRNPHHHLPSDTPETLDYDRMASLTIGLEHALRGMAGAAESADRDAFREKTSTVRGFVSHAARAAACRWPASPDARSGRGWRSRTGRRPRPRRGRCSSGGRGRGGRASPRGATRA